MDGSDAGRLGAAAQNGPALQRGTDRDAGPETGRGVNRHISGGVAVPKGRMARAARLGGVASGIMAGAAARGTGALLRGERPLLRDLLLTPANVGRLAGELARMRGAAMKMGQLLSMDAGDVLPPEIAEIMARLRADAEPMPPRQLRRVLDGAWGPGWLRRFQSFETTPVAAASIGQVHRARLRDGRLLAIKVQYPGVRQSIDSDVANVGTLVRLSDMLPPGVALDPLLDEARRQLHEEADYEREGAQLARFHALLAEDQDFVVPEPVPELTGRDVLAMRFVPGAPLESLAEAPQGERDRVMRLLLELMLREVFDFGLVQTDPNFGNYRYDRETGRVVLLDFGAARGYPPERVATFRALMRAVMSGDAGTLAEAGEATGFYSAETAPEHRDQVLGLMQIGSVPFRADTPHDFADESLRAQLRDRGFDLAMERDFDHVMPMDVLYLQRKVAGLYLLGARLKAQVHLRSLVELHL
ncbi:MAG: AarF/ABC1/UbiB kinase family protein [Pseudomonadota bacterium]